MTRIIPSAKIDGDPLVLSRTAPAEKTAFNLQEHAIKQASEVSYGKSDQDSIELSSFEKPEAAEETNDHADLSVSNKEEQAQETGADLLSNQHFSAVAEQALIEKKALEAERKEIDQERQNLEQERQEFLAEIESLKAEAKEEAKQSGYREGLKEGLISAENEHDEKMNELDSAIESLKQLYSKEISGLEDICLELVFESLVKVLGSELQKPEVVMQAVKQVISKARDTNKMTLHVSRKDYEVISQNKEELQSLVQGATVEIVPDSRVMLGGCLLESPDGSMDGRLEMQLQRLKEIFMNVRNSESKVIA